MLQRSPQSALNRFDLEPSASPDANPPERLHVAVVGDPQGGALRPRLELGRDRRAVLQRRGVDADRERVVGRDGHGTARGPRDGVLPGFVRRHRPTSMDEGGVPRAMICEHVGWKTDTMLEIVAHRVRSVAAISSAHGRASRAADNDTWPGRSPLACIINYIGRYRLEAEMSRPEGTLTCIIITRPGIAGNVLIT
jgi:hypothetical protein